MNFFDKISTYVKVVRWKDDFGIVNHILETDGNKERALEILNRILAIESKSEVRACVFLYKSMVLYFLKRYEESIEHCDLTMKDFPNCEPILTIKGDALRHLGKYQEAIELYNEILKIEPGNIDALMNMGFCLNSLGKYQEGINNYDKILEIEPWNINAIDNKTVSLKHLEETGDEIYKKDNRVVKIVKIRLPNTDMLVIGEQNVGGTWDINLIDPKLSHKESFKKNVTTETFTKFLEVTFKTPLPL